VEKRARWITVLALGVAALGAAAAILTIPENALASPWAPGGIAVGIGGLIAIASGAVLMVRTPSRSAAASSPQTEAERRRLTRLNEERARALDHLNTAQVNLRLAQAASARAQPRTYAADRAQDDEIRAQGEVERLTRVVGDLDARLGSEGSTTPRSGGTV
jgi:hypothetical protein